MGYAENMYQWLKRNGYADKYDHAGIYCIKIDNIIVYIGKSTNINWSKTLLVRTMACCWMRGDGMVLRNTLMSSIKMVIGRLCFICLLPSG